MVHDETLKEIAIKQIAEKQGISLEAAERVFEQALPHHSTEVRKNEHQTEIAAEALRNMIKDATKEAVTDAQKTEAPKPQEPEPPVVVHSLNDALEVRQQGKEFRMEHKAHNPTDPVDTVKKIVAEKKPEGAGNFNE
jgi:hypothetical protein